MEIIYGRAGLCRGLFLEAILFSAINERTRIFSGKKQILFYRNRKYVVWKSKRWRTGSTRNNLLFLLHRLNDNSKTGTTFMSQNSLHLSPPNAYIWHSRPTSSKYPSLWYFSISVYVVAYFVVREDVEIVFGFLYVCSNRHVLFVFSYNNIFGWHVVGRHFSFFLT